MIPFLGKNKDKNNEQDVEVLRYTRVYSPVANLHPSIAWGFRFDPKNPTKVKVTAAVCNPKDSFQYSIARNIVRGRFEKNDYMKITRKNLEKSLVEDTMDQIRLVADDQDEHKSFCSPRTFEQVLRDSYDEIQDVNVIREKFDVHNDDHCVHGGACA